MSEKFIHTVTVTGADDSATPAHLRDIGERYPFAEFGILFSPKHFGAPRFPSRSWLLDLQEDSRGLRLSGHLCGGFVRDFLAGRTQWLSDIGDPLCARFSRWQINTHGEPHDFSPDELSHLLERLDRRGCEVIFQYDNRNTAIIEACAARDTGNIRALFDLSHGAGVLPDRWPKLNLDIPVGYAGGLSPENLVSQIEGLRSASGGGRIWIDAETSLRTPDDAGFDLERVEAFLRAAEPYVTGMKD
jgi:hypothetical protein